LYVYDLYQIRNEYNKSSLSDKFIFKALLLKYSDNGRMIKNFINKNMEQVLNVINNNNLKSKVYKLLNKNSNNTAYSNHVYILYLTIVSIYLLGLLYNEVLGNKYDNNNASYKYTISVPQVNKLFNLGYKYTKSNIDDKLYSDEYKDILVEKIKYVLFMFIKQVSIKKVSNKQRKYVIPSFDNSIDYLVKYTNLISYKNIGDITITKKITIKKIKPILNNIIITLLNYS
jgi:hypothetical protein